MIRALRSAMRMAERGASARRLGVGCASSIATLALAGALSAGTTPVTLLATLKDVPTVGQEGPGFRVVFTLTLPGGKRVTTVPAGPYKLVVNDQSKILNFHLVGPHGADVRAVGGRRVVTGVRTKETVTFLVHLTKGTYEYYSDPHASSIRKSFRVF